MKHPSLFNIQTQQEIEISAFLKNHKIYRFQNAHAQNATLQFPPQKVPQACKDRF